jgi:Fungal Zn(2)-Cys(6) binuclear cluster domain
MSHQTLPSLATAIRYTAGTERRGDLAPPKSPFLTEGRLSVDATRELAKCANGEHVSHDVIRDGIDALLLMKRGSFDHSVSQDGRDYGEWRTGPEYPPALPAVQTPVWQAVSYEAKREIESSSDESDAEEDPGHELVAAEAPVVQKKVKPRKKSEGRKTASNKKALHLPPPPVNRPPTIWHTRKPELLPPPALPTPDSPKSKISLEEDSPEPQDEPSDEDADEEIGPATLHFSCIQCHRAKKRCNRTRPCSRCSSRGMDHQCSYPDKHDPRSVLRACLRCWQTKKKCDRKQPCCGKCEKVGVKCLYRRESAAESPEVTHLSLYHGY